MFKENKVEKNIQIIILSVASQVIKKVWFVVVLPYIAGASANVKKKLTRCA